MSKTVYYPLSSPVSSGRRSQGEVLSCYVLDSILRVVGIGNKVKIRSGLSLRVKSTSTQIKTLNQIQEKPFLIHEDKGFQCE